jgi:hypothetical protein
VAFQAGELVLSGAVQIADASAQELARSGNPASALAAGAAQARQVAETASAPVVAAVNTAVTNIRNSLHDPFPAATATATTVETPSGKKDSARATTSRPKHELKDHQPTAAKRDHPDNHPSAKKR